MLCPYCRVEYTLEQPCFCQPPAPTQKAESDILKSQGLNGYVRAVFDLRAGNRFSFRMELFRDGKGSEILVPGEEGIAMAMISLHRGLCLTCRNDLTCTYPRKSGRPVTQCEEFAGEVTAPRSPTGTSDPPSDSMELRSPSEEKYSIKYAGLCKICDSSETCTFPKPQGGAWHCDEYKLAGAEPPTLIA